MLPLENYLERLEELKGVDLKPYAALHNIKIQNNNGWFGDTLERCIGLPANKKSEPDFGDWELKTVKVISKNGNYKTKNPMALTRIKSDSFTEFEDSVLLHKIQKMIIVVRIDDKIVEIKKIILQELEEFYNKIKEDFYTLKTIFETHGYNGLGGKQKRMLCAKRKTFSAKKDDFNRAFSIQASYVNKILAL